MQAPEFDNLMDGKPSKLAQMFLNDKQDAMGLSGLLAKAKNPDATAEDVQVAREEIQKREVEIPSDMKTKIDAFIAEQRDNRVKERTIRRMVQKKFNITVI